MEWEDERGKWECEIGMKIKNVMGKMERENENDTLGFQLTPMSEFLKKKKTFLWIKFEQDFH